MKHDGGTGDLDIPKDGDEPMVPRLRLDPNLAASISEFSKKMQETCNGVGKAILDFASVAQKSGQMMARALSVDLKPVIDNLIKLRDNLNAFVELNPPKKMAAEYGWPPMFNMDLRYLADLYRGTLEVEDERKRQDYVDEKFKAYYQGPELDRLLAGWRNAGCLKGTDRLLIIEDAFEAYEAGKYSIASPAILAQTEGLFFKELVEGEDEDAVSWVDYKNLCQRVNEENGEGSIVAFVVDALTAFACGYGLYSSKAKPEQDDRSSTAYDISRNKVLHGSSTEYCHRQEISLRHLLWLDGVVQVIELVSNRGDSEP